MISSSAPTDLSVLSGLNVFVSYSRSDLEFVKEFLASLSALGIRVNIDSQGILPAEDWWPRLQKLISQADTVIVVLTPDAIVSDATRDEIEYANSINKRIIPITAAPLGDASPHEAIKAMDRIYFYEDPRVDQSGFGYGLARLVSALAVDAEWIREYTHIESQAQRWDNAGRLEELLAAGAELEGYIKWREKRPPNVPELSVLQEAYLGASEQYDNHLKSEARKRIEEKERAQRRFAYGLTIAGAVVAALLGLTLWQAGETTRRELVHIANLTKSAYDRGHYAEAMRLAVLGLPAIGESGWRALWGAKAHRRLETVAGAAGLSNHALAVLEGHSSAVFEVAISPKDKWFATASNDGTVMVWDIESGSQITKLSAHLQRTSSIDINWHGTSMVTASYDGTAIIWDTKTWKPKHKLKQHRNRIWFAQFSPDGNLVATTSQDRKVIIWDANSGKRVGRPIALPRPAQHLDFSPDGTKILIGCDDNNAYIVSIGDPETKTKLTGHKGLVRRVAFDPWGRFAATASLDNTARIWDVETGVLLAELKGHARKLFDIRFSRQGDRIVTTSEDRTARVWAWDSTSGGAEFVRALAGHTGGVYRARFDRTGRLIATAGLDNTTRLWNSDSGTQNARLIGHAQRVWAAEFTPDGKRIVTVSEDSTVRLWRTDNQATRKVVHLNSLPGTYQVVRGIISPTGKITVAQNGATKAELMDPASGEIVELEGHTGQVIALVFDADGKRIATTSVDRSARVYDANTGNLLCILEGGHGDVVRAMAFSPDGRLLATGGQDNIIRIWDGTSCKPGKALTGHSARILDLRFDRTGRSLLSGAADSHGILWDVETGEARRRFTGHTNWVRSVAISPDGRRAATGSYDRMVRIWDTATGETLHELQGHEASILATEFSPDSTKLLSASYDGTIRVWSIETGENVALLRGHEGPVRMATFGRTTANILSIGADRTLRTWNISAAIAKGGPLLSTTICSRYLPPSLQAFSERTLSSRELGDVIGEVGPGRNPCSRRGFFARDYWQQFLGAAAPRDR